LKWFLEKDFRVFFEKALKYCMTFCRTPVRLGGAEISLFKVVSRRCGIQGGSKVIQRWFPARAGFKGFKGFNVTVLSFYRGAMIFSCHG